MGGGEQRGGGGARCRFRGEDRLGPSGLLDHPSPFSAEKGVGIGVRIRVEEEMGLGVSSKV